jgi:hypothetical protein
MKTARIHINNSPGITAARSINPVPFGSLYDVLLRNQANPQLKAQGFMKMLYGIKLNH